MQIKNISQNSVAYKGVLNNKLLKKGLEFAANNGSLFSASACVGLSLLVRPVAILLTPKAKKEDKQYACARSISSALLGLGVMALVSVPISNAVKKIESSPQKYLKQSTINILKDSKRHLKIAKPFQFASQMIKLSSGFIATVPRAFLISALIPPIMDFIFNKKAPQQTKQKCFGKNVSFKGVSGSFTKSIGKIMNFEPLQRLATKYKNSNLPQHMFSLNDIFATGMFIHFTNKNNKIDSDRKRTLNYNSAIGTAMTVALGYGVDKCTNKPSQKFIKKFIKANRDDKNLRKYIEGLKIVKPVLILGTLYYAVAPVVSTILADVLSNKDNGVQK